MSIYSCKKSCPSNLTNICSFCFKVLDLLLAIKLILLPLSIRVIDYNNFSFFLPQPSTLGYFLEGTNSIRINIFFCHQFCADSTELHVISLLTAEVQCPCFSGIATKKQAGNSTRSSRIVSILLSLFLIHVRNNPYHHVLTSWRNSTLVMQKKYCSLQFPWLFPGHPPPVPPYGRDSGHKHLCKHSWIIERSYSCGVS